MSNKTEIRKIKDQLNLGSKDHHFLLISGGLTEWDKEISGDYVGFGVGDVENKKGTPAFKETGTGKIVPLEYIQNLVSRGHKCFTIITDCNGL